jgi:hypothetical protein
MRLQLRRRPWLSKVPEGIGLPCEKFTRTSARRAAVGMINALGLGEDLLKSIATDAIPALKNQTKRPFAAASFG